MAEVAPPPAEDADERLDGEVNTFADEPPPTPAADGTALQAAQRAREMAEYSERLLAPWRVRVEELGRECGRLTAEADHLRKRLAEERAERERWEAVLAEAEAAEVSDTVAPHRPWWLFWRRKANVADRAIGAVAESS